MFSKDFENIMLQIPFSFEKSNQAKKNSKKLSQLPTI
jgi:hypothetical protein